MFAEVCESEALIDELEQAQRAITDLEAERGDDQEVPRLRDELQALQARPLDRFAVPYLLALRFVRAGKT